MTITAIQAPTILRFTQISPENTPGILIFMSRNIAIYSHVTGEYAWNPYIHEKEHCDILKYHQRILLESLYS